MSIGREWFARENLGSTSWSPRRGLRLCPCWSPPPTAGWMLLWPSRRRASAAGMGEEVSEYPSPGLRDTGSSGKATRPWCLTAKVVSSGSLKGWRHASFELSPCVTGLHGGKRLCSESHLHPSPESSAGGQVSGKCCCSGCRAAGMGDFPPTSATLPWLHAGRSSLHQDAQIRSPVRFCSSLQPCPPQSSSSKPKYTGQTMRNGSFQGHNSQGTCGLLFACWHVKEAAS